MVGEISAVPEDHREFQVFNAIKHNQAKFGEDRLRTAQEPLQASSTASTERLLTFLCSPIYMEQLELVPLS